MMLKYSDFIKTDKAFQYSINLKFDIDDKSKIEHYIPVKDSIEILKDFLKSVYYKNSDRAKVLIGPYGKGKSHLMLVLLTILASDDIILKEILAEKIKRVDKDAYKLVKEIISTYKFLPIIVNGNNNSLEQAFRLALKEALEKKNLHNLIPNTYFDSVVEIIEKWKQSYSDTFDKFKNKLFDQGIRYEKFIVEIKRYNKKYYDLFKDIYFDLSKGIEFNPLINSDVIDMFMDVNRKLCNEYGYSGIYIVFDEFSKFLEDKINITENKNLKLLQDLAEVANRSGENQIHFICITHKSINDYTHKLPNELINSWRAVEGRFKEIYFISSMQQNYDLVGNAIVKDEVLFNKFIENFNENYSNDIRKFSKLKCFEYVSDFENDVYKKCFPLNPIAAYCLPIISEKVAQNERTLFTFISKDEPGSLTHFIKTHNFGYDLIGLDKLYDYFEILFKKETFNQNVYFNWLKSKKALNKAKNERENKIIKAITIINIVNQFDVLPPTNESIKLGVYLENEEFEEALENLLVNRIIIRKKINGFLDILESSYIDIEKEIKILKETKVKNVNYSDYLNQKFPLGYIYPKRYNDKFEIIRYFKVAFIDYDELLNSTETILLNKYQSDGILFNIVYFNDNDQEKIIEKLKLIKDKRLLFNVTKKPFDLKDDILSLLAIEILKNKHLDDEQIIEEINNYEEDLYEFIKKKLSEVYSIENNIIIHNGEYKKFESDVILNRYISEICETVYYNYPIINNELINKNNLTPQIKRARQKIIKYLLENKLYEEMLGNGPEVTIYKSTIVNNGLLDANDSKNNSINVFINEIKSFLETCIDTKQPLRHLYDKLISPPYGVRKGPIPIYISYVLLRNNYHFILYYNDKEIKVDYDIFDEIEKNVDNYFILIEKSSVERNDYINKLVELFNPDHDNKNYSDSYKFTLDSIKRWYFSLPKNTKEFDSFIYDDYKEISSEIKKFRKEIVKPDLNPREFIVEKLPKLMNSKNDFDKTIKKLTSLKFILDEHISNVKNFVIKKTIEVINNNYEGELATLLYNWYRNLDESVKEISHDIYINNFLKYLSELKTFNSYEIVNDLAFILTNFHIEDWNDEHYYLYFEKLKEIINYFDILKNNAITNLNNDNYYKIEYIDKNQVINKKIKQVQLSYLGKSLFNEIEEIIEEFSDSIDADEKRNVLIEVLKKYL